MKEMDRILRNKLQDHASDMPSDMWSRIEMGMQEEKKDRGLFFYLISGFIFLAFISISYLGYNFIASSNDAFSSYDTQENSFNAVAKADHPFTTEITAVNEILSASDSEPQLVSERSNSLVNQDDSSPNSIGISEYISESQALRQNAPEAMEIVGGNGNEISNIDKITSVEYGAAIPEDKQEIDRGQFTNIAFLNSSVIPLLENSRSFGDPVGCPTFSSRSPLNLYVEAHYSPLAAMKFVSSNSPEIGQEYLNLRENTERALYSWSAGINVGYISPYNIGVRAGLNYEVINERFVYEDPDAVRNQTIIVIDTIFNQDGSTTINSDTSVVQVAGFEKLQIYNYHRSVEIPLHLTYYLDLREIDFEISGGPNINIDYTNRGKIVDPSNEDQWFTNGENGSYKVFKDRLDVSFSLAISALYNINEKVQLYARPHFKYNPSSMTVNSSPFNQNYAVSGLALGARYYFSGNPNY